MKSPPPGNGPPNGKEEKSVEPTAEQTQSEKDSGYYDSSSESLSSEETPPPSTATSMIITTTTTTPSEGPQTQTADAPVYILQNVVLKEPHVVLLLLQPPLKRHRKRVSPSSYLPILRSYPKIAPRIAPPSPAPDPPKDTAPVPSGSSKVCKQQAPQLLEVSLRSLALLRRTRETQRSICELKAHTILYERALQGEEGGWERLRKAMEISGGYRKIPPPVNADRTEKAGVLPDTAEETAMTMGDSAMTPGDSAMTPGDSAMTPGDSAMTPGDSAMTPGDSAMTPGDSAMTPGDSAMTTDDTTPTEEKPQTEENVTSPKNPMTSEETAPSPDSDTEEAA